MLSFFFGAFACWFFLLLLIPELRRRLLDHPNARSSHQLPTPRGGGIVFVLLTGLSSLVAVSHGYGNHLSALPLIAVPLAFVGLLDDLYNLPVSLRYAVQLSTAVFALFFSLLVQESLFVFMSGNWIFLLIIPFLLIAFTAVINFINFMDGLNGLVGGCMAIAIAALSLFLNAPWPLWILVGSLLGFLFWNWGAAKVFMGDIGSTFLGAVFACLVLQASNWIEAFGFLLLAFPLLGDAFFCVLRRLLAGQSVLKAHRLHLFQRLHQAGWRHTHVSLLYIFAVALLAAAFLSGGLPWLFGLSFIEFLLGMWLDQRVAVPFALASST